MKKVEGSVCRSLKLEVDVDINSPISLIFSAGNRIDVEFGLYVVSGRTNSPFPA